MTKRFTITGDRSISDHQKKRLYDLSNFDGMISVTECLNELSEENEQLKSFKSRVFNLLQDGIREESELLDYYIKEKAPCNADRQQVIIGVLKRLQKELK